MDPLLSLRQRCISETGVLIMIDLLQVHPRRAKVRATLVQLNVL